MKLTCCRCKIDCELDAVYDIFVGEPLKPASKNVDDFMLEPPEPIVHTHFFVCKKCYKQLKLPSPELTLFAPGL